MIPRPSFPRLVTAPTTLAGCRWNKGINYIFTHSSRNKRHWNRHLPLLSPWALLLLRLSSKSRLLWFYFLLDSQGRCRNHKLMNVTFLSGVLFSGVTSTAAYCRSVPFELCASRLSTSSFFHANGTWWRAESARILIVKSSWSPCYFVLRATTAGGTNPLPKTAGWKDAPMC